MENHITWNVTNWVTVFLMALGGFLILKSLLKGVEAFRGGASDA